MQNPVKLIQIIKINSGDTYTEFRNREPLGAMIQSDLARELLAQCCGYRLYLYKAVDYPTPKKLVDVSELTKYRIERTLEENFQILRAYSPDPEKTEYREFFLLGDETLERFPL